MMNRSTVLDITWFGWKSSDGCLEIDWDHPLNYAKFVNELIFYSVVALKKGCDTRRCSCLKTGKICGPGCRCCTCIVIHKTDGTKNEEMDDDEIIRQTYYNEMVEDEDGDIETYEEGSEDMDCAASDDDDLEDLRIYRFVLH